MRFFIIPFCLAGLLTCLSLAHATETTTPIQVVPFPLNAVQLDPGPFRDAMERNVRTLLAHKPDRFLHNFRKNAGLQPKAPIYPSWESEGVAGQTLGHYLTALCYQYASTGETELLERINYVVDELALCQEANGNGYVSAIPDGKRIFAEIAQGKIDVSPFGLNGGWVPWYTMHKLLAGLHDAHVVAGNRKARAVLVKLADWVDQVTQGLSADQLANMLKAEFGGMNEALLNVAVLTGNSKYQKVADRFFHHAVLDPLARQQDELEGLHANTQVPKIIGVAQRYNLLGHQRDRIIAEFFWSTVVRNHTYVMGGNSEHEHFGPPRQLAKRLGPTTAETCNTYNMLKLTGKLFAWEPRGELFDYYERALYNHILASQEPRHGAFTYYVSLKPGHFKTWSKPEEAFWCCVGTGFENHTRYTESIYYHDDEGLYVNLFVPSRLRWEEKGLELRQQTSFPQEGITALQFKLAEPTTLTLRIRKPEWAAEGFSVLLNGEKLKDVAFHNGYTAIRRTWDSSDTVTVQLPLRLRRQSTPENPRKIAILYGPLVLAADMGSSGMVEPMPYTDNQASYFDVPTPRVPVLVTDNRPVVEWLRPVSGQSLTFRTVGAGVPDELTFVPFYSKYYGRYSVYLDEFTTEGWKAAEAAFRAEQERQRELASRTVDEIRPGEQQMEIEHNFMGKKSRTGSHSGRKWRDAEPGGWFSYDLKVLPDTPQQLVCTWWGSDSGNRKFRILVDGTPFQEVELRAEKPEEFIDSVYDLPAELTRGKKKITVRFEGLPGNLAGGVFGIRVLRPSAGGTD